MQSVHPSINVDNIFLSKSLGKVEVSKGVEKDELELLIGFAESGIFIFSKLSLAKNLSIWIMCNAYWVFSSFIIISLLLVFSAPKYILS